MKTPKLIIRFYREENESEMTLNVTTYDDMLGQIQEHCMNLTNFDNEYVKDTIFNIKNNPFYIDWDDLAFDLVDSEDFVAIEDISVDDCGTPNLYEIEEMAEYGTLYYQLAQHHILSGCHQDIIAACELTA